MRGNFDETFFDSINEVFVCLVTSAMRHCLKAWATGVYIEPPKTAEFKYETAASEFSLSDAQRTNTNVNRNFQKISQNLGSTPPQAPETRLVGN